VFGGIKRDAAVAAAGMAGTALPGGGGSAGPAAAAAGGDGSGSGLLPEVHTGDPNEEANAIRKALRIKVRFRFHCWGCCVL